MTEKERNDYFYVCSLIEYIARETLNHRSDIVKTIGKEGIEKLLHDAEVDHCLSFEQVSDEIISYYGIEQGSFDTITGLQIFCAKFSGYWKIIQYHDRGCCKARGRNTGIIKDIFFFY